MQHLNTIELVARACAGSDAAWAELVRRYEGLVWSVIVAHGIDRVDAGDVSQTVWLKLAQHIGRLNDPERVGLWLASTTRHECYAVTRKRARSVPVDIVDLIAPPDPQAEAPISRLEDLERDYALWEAFLDLPVKCQSLLKLLITDPPTGYTEIAESCGIAVGSIGSRRQRCLHTLRLALQNHPAIVA